jgi:hypothetical protein
MTNEAIQKIEMLLESKVAGGMLLGGLAGAGLNGLLKYNALTGYTDGLDIDFQDLPEVVQSQIMQNSGVAANHGTAPGMLLGGLLGAGAAGLTKKSKGK